MHPAGQVDAATEYNRTPLSYAIQKNNRNMVKLLHDGCKVEINVKFIKVGYGCTAMPFTQSCQGASSALLTRSSGLRALLNQLDNLSSTMQSMFPYLIHDFTRPDDRMGGQGCREGWLESKGASETSPLPRLKSPLLVFVLVVLHQGEDCTPLILAAKLGHNDIVKLLLKWGSDLDEKDAHGKTALEYAEDGGYIKVAGMIRETAEKRAAANGG